MATRQYKKDIDVLCVGIAVTDVFGKSIDKVPDWGRLATFDHIEHHIGGCAVNTAVNLARLGARTAIGVCIGHDSAGNFVKQRLSENDLDISGVVETKDASTSFTFIMIDSDGQRRYLHHVGANAVFTDSDISNQLLRRSRFLYIGGSLLMPNMDGEPTARLLKRAKNLGLKTFMDTAYNPKVCAQDLIHPCLKYLDVFMPSVEEAEMITGKTSVDDMLQSLCEHNVPVVGIKLGPEGCIIRSDGETHRQPAFKVEPVDVSGAGDSFVAGFIFGQLQSWPIDKTAVFANAVAAHCIRSIGCSTGIRPAKEILDFIGLNR